MRNCSDRIHTRSLAVFIKHRWAEAVLNTKCSDHDANADVAKQFLTSCNMYFSPSAENDSY